MPDLPDSTRSSSGPAWKRLEHQSTRLLAMSFDGAASPSLTLKGASSHQDARDMPYGWGMAWYPGQGSAALLIKDPTSIGDNAMTKLLRDWERFASTTFICHLRGAARRLQEEDTHPFARSHGRRDWVLAHNGDLFGDLASDLSLGPDPVFEPIGRTDSEHAFCWLLEQIRAAGAKRLGELGWPALEALFRKLDSLGTANFLLTDGIDIAAYSDGEGYNPLHWARLSPPHREVMLESDDLLVDLDDASDRSRTAVLVSTRPLGQSGWAPMQPGQLLVLRRGTVIHDSHADARSLRAMVPPLPPSVVTPTQRAAVVEPRVESSIQHPGRADGAPIPSARRSGLAPSLPSPTATPAPLVGRELTVLHETVYRYDQPVERSSHLYRLRPVHDLHQEVLAHELSISVDGLRRDFEDVFGNHATSLELETPYHELRITARSRVRVAAETSPQLLSPSRRVSLPLVWMPWQRQMMLPYLLPPELFETQLTELYEYALSFVERQDSDLVQTLLDMNMTIYRDFRYESGSTTLATTPFDVYGSRRGVCQDFANLMICLARLLGIPARYRVGYIYTGAGYENKVQSDASHAWLEVYLPRNGWQGFDPTNGCLVGQDHVRVACGRNYLDATPTSGTLYKGGGGETLVVSVRVEEGAEGGARW